MLEEGRILDLWFLMENADDRLLLDFFVLDDLRLFQLLALILVALHDRRIFLGGNRGQHVIFVESFARRYGGREGRQRQFRLVFFLKGVDQEHVVFQELTLLRNRRGGAQVTVPILLPVNISERHVDLFGALVACKKLVRSQNFDGSLISETR